MLSEDGGCCAPVPVAKNGFVLQYTMPTGCKWETRAHGKCFLGSDASMFLDRNGYPIVAENHSRKKVVTTSRLANAEKSVPASDDHLYDFQVFWDNVRRRKQERH